MKKGSVVTIGVFDGVHLGHSAVIKKAVEISRARRLRSVAVTFNPHPAKTLGARRSAPSLISLKHRVSIIKSLGIDEVVVIRFDTSAARVSARDFVEDILIAQLGAKEIIVGEDFRFGRGASAGNAELRNIAAAHSVRVTVVRKVKAGRRAVSSTLIRQRIASGRFGEASRMLGRPFSVLGTVVSGTRLGRALGYPTANLNPHHEAMPPSGVYAVKVIFGRKTYKGVMNIGVKPTFYDHGRDKEPSIEVHIFDFHRKVYGKDLEVEFVRKLRDERRFKTIDSLVAQIRADAALAKKLLYKTA